MKPTVWITALVFSAVLWSCEKNTPQWPAPEVQLMPNDGCNSAGLKSDHLPTDQSCIYYQYLEDSLLEITHLNAGFNCCPSEIFVDVTLQGDTLLITEREKDGFCDCNCLYDLNFTITHIPPGSYLILFDEQYRSEIDPEISFTVQLGDQNSGEFCVDRSRYPWGV